VTDTDEIPDTSTCGCCRTVEDEMTHTNKPGQPALGYRIGTHGSFLRRMIRRLPLLEVMDGTGHIRQPLANLTTQETSDPSIALLDAFAVVGDVLTFYQERIANECYLRTATERRSVLELAREISYELNPGVAAGTWLAFTVETAIGAPESVTIAQGTKIQSLPAPGKLPQTFETSEDLVARPEWNALRPTTTIVHELKSGSQDAYLEKVNLGLKPGDYLLFVGSERSPASGDERWDIRQINDVQEFPRESYTKVSWKEKLGYYINDTPVVQAASNPKIYIFRKRASLFGYNAVDWSILSDEVRKSYVTAHGCATGAENDPGWPQFTLNEIDTKMTDSNGTIFLDAIYPGIFPETWCALSVPGYVELYWIKDVAEDSRTEFALTAKTTRLKIEGENLLKVFNKKIRKTVVLLSAEELTPAKEPYTNPVQNNNVILNQRINGLMKGKTLIIAGISSGDGTPVSEAVTLSKDAEIGDYTTTLTFTGDLKNSYRRDSVTIYANVVPATHGETVREILGSGDAGLANQQFTLKKPPLTYVPDTTPSGGRSTLSVRVDGLEWTESPALYGKNGMSENYTIRIGDDAKAVIIFGDGTEGARLTTGVENVTAVYRSGIGPDGEVARGTLCLLPVRPTGIREVTNPMAATGAAAPEGRDDARGNAPLKVRTLERIVSLRDYEDFARAYSGIAKARGDTVWGGEETIVLITVLGPGGKIIEDGTIANPGTLENLRDSITAWQDPGHSVRIKSAKPLFFDIHVSVLFDTPRYEEEMVRNDIHEALKEAFSFEKMGFAQNVSESDLIGVIQGVPGVTAASIDNFTILPDCSSAGYQSPSVRKENASCGRYLPAKPADISLLPDGGIAQISGAEILLICPERITITGWKA
jgi:hypothetical protein